MTCSRVRASLGRAIMVLPIPSNPNHALPSCRGVACNACIMPCHHVPRLATVRVTCHVAMRHALMPRDHVCASYAPSSYAMSCRNVASHVAICHALMLSATYAPSPSAMLRRYMTCMPLPLPSAMPLHHLPCPLAMRHVLLPRNIPCCLAP